MFSSRAMQLANLFQTYDELMSLAAKGRHFVVHESDQSECVKSTESEEAQKDNQYTVMFESLSEATEVILFCFGHGLQKGIGECCRIILSHLETLETLETNRLIC